MLSDIRVIVTMCTGHGSEYHSKNHKCPIIVPMDKKSFETLLS